MGTNRLFWSQELLDRWILEEKISLEEDRLTTQEDQREYRVSQAVYFTADVGDGDDPHNLVGRVKDVSQLEEMGAEHYMDSVLVEDCAYQVTQGFVGMPFEKAADDAEERPKDITGAIAKQTGEGPDSEDDRELLAKFLLENL